MSEISVIIALVLIVLGAPIALSIWALRVGYQARREAEDAKMRFRVLESQIALSRMQTPPDTIKVAPPLFPVPSKPIDPKPSFAEEPKPPVLEEPKPIPVPPVKIPSIPTPFHDDPSKTARLPAYVKTDKLASAKSPSFEINWEQFLGAKLFAWVGAFAALLTVIFFIKYSFDHNLINPSGRVAIGYLIGIAFLIGGLLLPRQKYSILVQSMAATGILILYADTFAAHAYYKLIDSEVTFGLMVLITAAAFLVSIRLNALATAIIAMVGGFLTPPLLGTGQDNPGGLFGYVALLNIGLAATAFRQRWNILIFLGAMGTIIMEIGWVIKFFAVSKIFIAMTVFLGFSAFFVGIFIIAHKLDRIENHVSAAGIMMPFSALAFAAHLLWHPYPEIAGNPLQLFSFVFFADLALLAMSYLRNETRNAHSFAGAAIFLILASWTIKFLTVPLMNWALAFYLLFAILHSVYPLFLRKQYPEFTPKTWIQLFPAAGLLLMIVSLGKGLIPTLLFWPAVLLLDLAAVVFAVATASIIGVLAVLILTMAALGIWITTPVTATTSSMTAILIIVGGFAGVFFAAGIFTSKRIMAKLINKPADEGSDSPSEIAALLPCLSAFLPFLLLTMMIMHLPMTNPSPIFGLALLMVFLLLAAALIFEVDWLPLVGLVCVLVVEHVWWGHHHNLKQAGLILTWNTIFFAVFLIYPFIFQGRLQKRIIPWIAASISGPAHFYIVYQITSEAFKNPYMGLLPAAFAIPSIFCLIYLLRTIPTENAQRNTQLAWFGGVALFFITLIFPIQFEKQWLTVGWALEGAALLWLFHRVPHHGLRLIGSILLAVAFCRLTLNSAVFRYHPQSERAIFNWYLYTYGIVTACLIGGGRLLVPPNHKVIEINARAVLYGMGGILAFFLLNIEIADYFSQGQTLTFQFSGNTARDMTYSIAWAVYAMILLGVGFKAKNTGARYAGLGLLVITLIKLFFHDLWRLGGLYRIGSFLGLAIALFLVSFVYQKFLAAPQEEENKEEPPPLPPA